MAEISPLRRCLIKDMATRNLSPATQQSYICAIAKFSPPFRPLSGPAGTGGCAWLPATSDRAAALVVSYQYKTVCAQRFFDGVTSGRSGANQQIVAARKPQRLPVVLSGEEIARFLKAVPGLCNRVALTTAYWAGLRVGEVVRLTAAAMDSSRMLIRIEQGKGGNDRYVMLSLRTAIVRRSWRYAVLCSQPRR